MPDPAPSMIWRFPLPPQYRVVLTMPRGARTLSVGPFRQSPGDGMYYRNPPLDLWALVDPAAVSEDREFLIVGTGNPIPADARNYVGTTYSDGGDLIWHVFESSRTFGRMWLDVTAPGGEQP